MTGTELMQNLEFEAGIKVGDTVVARWTNCYRYYSDVVTVVKVNKSSFRVALSGKIDGYPKGHQIPIPRMMTRTWGAPNCVRPFVN